MFKVGDVVVLKAGGPKMTVSYADFDYDGEDGPDVKCQWFDDKQRLQTDLFSSAMLDKA